MSFQETIRYLANRLKSPLPTEISEEKGVDFALDNLVVTARPAHCLGGVNFSIPLGLLLYPSKEIHLKELMTSHFLGVQTEGCSFVLDEAGVTLCLRITTLSGMTMQENWEWLHRVVGAAYGWMETLVQWDEFVPLLQLPEKRDRSDE